MVVSKHVFFPSTHWSLLARATVDGQTEARSALEELCRRYWAPLKQFIRSRGYTENEAADLTQEFLLHLLERAALRRADPLKGKFRSFLLGALANFLAHERERRLTQKRGGQYAHVSAEVLDEESGLSGVHVPPTDTAAFDRTWALAVLRVAMQRLQREYTEAGKADLFVGLRAFLPGGKPPPPYEQAAAELGMSVAAFNSEIHRLRRQFRDCICDEVMATVSAPHEIDEEIAHLYEVLMDRGTNLG